MRTTGLIGWLVFVAWIVAAGRAVRAGQPGDYIVIDDIDDWEVAWFCGHPAVREWTQGPAREGAAVGVMAFDSQGTAYMACGTFIQVIKDGTARVLAGAPGIGGNTDGPPWQATFGEAIDIALVNDDLLYVVDAANFTLRRLERRDDGRWHTTTVAGVPGRKGHRDGPGPQALFTNPFESIAVDENGVVYLLGGDWLRKFENGVVTTLNAGSGYENGPLGGARFSRSQGRAHGMTYDGQGNLYIADKLNMSIRKVDLRKREVTTVAGVLPGVSKTPSRDGPAFEARFHPGGGPNIAFYNPVHGMLIVRSDDEGDRIRAVAGGWVKTFGPGPGRKSAMVGPWRTAVGGVPCGVDRAGNVYIMDGRTVRVVRKKPKGADQ